MTGGRAVITRAEAVAVEESHGKGGDEAAKFRLGDRLARGGVNERRGVGAGRRAGMSIGAGAIGQMRGKGGSGWVANGQRTEERADEQRTMANWWRTEEREGGSRAGGRWRRVANRGSASRPPAGEL